MLIEAKDRKTIVESIRQKWPPTTSLILKFSNQVMEVRTNLPELHDTLVDYYEPFLEREAGTPDIVITAHETETPNIGIALIQKPPDPGKNKIKEEYTILEGGRLVRKRLTGMVFVFGGEDHLACGPCLENNNQVINFINNRVIEKALNKGFILGHAAGILMNGKGLALAGVSGAGKSTLALHLLSRGATFVSNDRLLVERTGQGLSMHGVAKMPRINPGTALNNPDLAKVIPNEQKDRFLSLSTEELWNLEHKYDVMISECFGKNRFVLEGPMDALVILNWKVAPEPANIGMVDINLRRDLLRAFMKPAGVFINPSRNGFFQDPSEEDYIKTLGDIPVFEITGGVDFTEACDRLGEFMGSGGSSIGIIEKTK